MNDQAPKVTRARVIIEIEDGLPRIPQEVWAVIDARLDALPQPDSRFERDRWRMISRETVYAAVPALAAQDSGEIPPELAKKVLDWMARYAVVLTPAHELAPYLARIAGRTP